jgi:putative ABC transport system substrate-binding protein
MIRREVLTLLGGAAAAWPLAARAQQSERMRRIGVLFATGQKDPDTPNRIAAMRQALQSFGWNEGKNLWIDIRFGDGDTKIIQKHAGELVGSNPDAILVLGTVVVMALQQVTRSIPVVFVQVSDPVKAGFVSSLSHPGGNITGFTTYEYTIGGKWLEVLKDISPSVTQVLFLLNPENSAQWAGYNRAFEAFGPTIGVRIVPGAVRDRDEIESVIDRFAREPNGGLLVPPDAITVVHQQLIVRLADRHRLPAVYPYRAWAVNGGLLSYGIDVVDQFRRATSYINRILKGENPGDLPVQAPTEFKLVINLKTAKTLGLDVPTSLIARADEVIE